MATPFDTVHPAAFRQYVEENNNALKRLNDAVTKLAGDNSALRIELTKAIKSEAQKSPRFVEDIPGPRTPYSYVVTIPFTAAATVIQSRSVTIATDGPFICTDIEAFYRITNAGHALVGIWLPVCTLPFRISLAGAGAGGPGVPAGAPEFSFKITTGGSGRQWQSDWLAGPVLKGYQFQSRKNGIAGWIDRTNTLTVDARPEVALGALADGDVWFYFHGYQILTPQNLTETFGWHS